MVRGGAINYQKGSTDLQHLTDALTKFVKDTGPFSALDFGEYTSLTANQAVRGPALAKIGPLVMCLLNVRPDACIMYTDLKSAFQNVMLKFPDLVQKNKDVQSCAGDAADRCMVILKHARSLALGEHADTIWSRSIANVPHYLMPVLQSIRDSIMQSEPSKSTSANTKRKLEVHHSNVSLDEMGLPALNFAGATPKPTATHQNDPLAYAAEHLGIVPPTKYLLKQSMGLVLKKPASAIKKPAIAQKKLKDSSGSVSSTVAAKGNQQIDMTSLQLKGPFKEKSYIVHKKPPTLVVGCSHAQSADHFNIMKQVLQYIKKTPGCTKLAAVQKRNQLVSK